MIRIFTPLHFHPDFSIASWIVHPDGTVITNLRIGKKQPARYINLEELELGVRDGRFKEVGIEEPPKRCTNYASPDYKPRPVKENLC